MLGLLRVLGSVLALMVCGLNAAAVDAAAPGSDLETRPSLAEDEAYLRQGAITNIETCLVVANDLAAVALWQREFEGQYASSRRQAQLAAILAGPDSRFAHLRGFGTLLMCAQVVRAWRASLPEHIDGGLRAAVRDGRIEYGTLVIDLQARGRRAFIEPVPLIRLLTSPGLLPKTAFGGVVVRNAIVSNTLVFNNIHLAIPLSFVHVKFLNGQYSRGIVAKPEVSNRSISILYSSFDEALMISNSSICGNMNINDSQFAETVELTSVHLGAEDCLRSVPFGSTERQGEIGLQAGPAAAAAQRALPQKPPSLRIDASRFEQSLRIDGSRLPFLMLTSNQIGSILWGGASFEKRLELVNNDIGSLQIDDSRLADATLVNYNRVASDLFIRGDREAKPSGRVGTVEIASNRIGGGLGFEGYSSAVLPERLRFTSNHVGNGSEICVPRDWRGEVQLDGSAFEGTLTLGVVGNRNTIPWSAENPCQVGFERPSEWVNVDRLNGDYCARIGPEEEWPPLTINLTATRISTLKWHLPLKCTYRWSGFGLTYDLWLPFDDARLRTHARRKEGGDWAEVAFRAWRTTLKDFEPAPLDWMSRYLAGNGAYVPSREIQIEAKRLNYAPDCPPHRPIWHCLGGLLPPVGLLGGQAEAADAGGDPEDGPQPFWPTWWGELKQTLTLLFLLPAGYGAAPEYALVFMICGFATFALIYWTYGRVLIWRYRGALRATSETLAGLRSEGPGQADPELASIARRLQELQQARPKPQDAVAFETELLPALLGAATRLGLDGSTFERLRNRELFVGTTERFGFSRFNEGQHPTRFTPWRYSIDAMIPVIDLHAYSNYFPEWWPMRGLTVLQHLLGWWWLTVFVASAAIL